jgi:hypothetical protein
VDAYRQDLISLRKLEELLGLIGLGAAEVRKFLVKANLLARATG